MKRRILLGTYVLSKAAYEAYFFKACQVRRKIQNQVFSAFQTVDLLLTPVSPRGPFPLGNKVRDPLAMYETDAWTSFVNLAGVPAMACPLGDRGALPLGLQLVAHQFCEEKLFDFARVLEREGIFVSEVVHVP